VEFMTSTPGNKGNIIHEGAATDPVRGRTPLL
jgi:hypothetical protein